MVTNGWSHKLWVSVYVCAHVWESERTKLRKREIDLQYLIVLFGRWHAIKILYQQVRPKRGSNDLCSDLLIEFHKEKQGRASTDTVNFITESILGLFSDLFAVLKKGLMDKFQREQTTGTIILTLKGLHLRYYWLCCNGGYNAFRYTENMHVNKTYIFGKQGRSLETNCANLV